MDSGQTRQVTRFTDYDVDVPALGANAITFQQGGRLWVLELPSETLHAIPVELPPDVRAAPREAPAADSVRRRDVAGGSDQALAGDGQTAFLAARGDLFAVRPDGTVRNLTNTPGIDDDHPSVAPDGRTLAFITDAGGEQQVATMPIEGGTPHVLTHFESGVLYTPRWSPDGRFLAVADAEHTLWLVQADGKGTARMATDPYAEIHDARFSPDNRWLAYSTTRPTQQRAIHLRELATGVDTVVSSTEESDHEPIFSSDGRYLFFVSARHELPIVSDRDRETDIATVKSDGLYVAALAAETPSFAAAPAASAVQEVDAAGLMARAVEVPVEAANVSQLEVREQHLFYRTAPVKTIGGDLPGEASALHGFDLATRMDRVIVTGNEGCVISQDGTTALMRRGDTWALVSTATGDSRSLALDAMRAKIVPRAEWREMIDQAWRLDRDLFWDPAMSGVDWRRVRAAYSSLGARAGSHEDVVYLLGELQGELSSSHMFIAGVGDEDSRKPVTTGLPGADFVLDPSSGRYRLAHVYRGDETRRRFEAPLGQPGLGVADGDFLLAIDGQELRAPTDPYALLLGKNGAVEFSVAHEVAGSTGRKITIEPIADEFPIRQLDWVGHNRATVERISGGLVGYVYLSDFSELGSEDFVRQYYAQTDKRGLVIDVRWNGGGFTSQWVLGLLRRRLAGGFLNREGGITTLPGALPPAAIAVVINVFSASDGDQFPYYFSAWKMGTVVGERTWGGVRGIKGPWRLIDGTIITVPKDALFSPGGKWIIENQGATPDIDVTNQPAALAAGRDEQLETATGELLRTLRGTPPHPLEAPARPGPGPARPHPRPAPRPSDRF